MEEISPLGRIPVLYDGGVHIYESGMTFPDWSDITRTFS